ncbi:MAG: BadF/BadG/BcrA/BcrD ATPase family protein [Arthrobacter sp.]|uniref:N-acetylglucosamine kinase n=1 Tax=Arthrobacter sp. TaxID=1667 RepID=UPI00348328D0
MAEAILAIDAGQTGIRALAVRPDGTRAVHEFPGMLTDRPLGPQFRAVVARVGAAEDLSFPVVAAGSTGLIEAQREAEELLASSADLGVRAVHLAHDSVTSYLGALGDRTGAVVAAGTGVVTLAVGERDVARVDGWGYLIGDAGSGFWLGRAALDAAMRGHDGRGAETALTAAMRADFPDLEHAYIDLQADPNRVSRIAGYSRHATALAETDAVAAGICDAAAAELALSVATGLRRVGEDVRPAPVVCFLGGVLRAPQIRDRLARRLEDLWPQVDLREPAASGLDGAALLPSVGAGSALAHQIHRAGG